MAVLTPSQAGGVTGCSRRGLTVLVALILAIWGGSAGAGLAQPAALEYAIKANFLYKFGPFVEWPPQTFASPSSAFNVCVAGEDPFGSALDDAVRGQTVGGHPVVVRRLKTVPANPPCHVLYVGRSPDQKPADVMRLVRGAPVLTVTDEQLGTSGGIVHFVLRQGRVRFGVDAGTAQADGLAISSKLLQLAVPLGGAG